MRTIIFTIRHSGHNLEYIDHLCQVCLSSKNGEYIFLIPIELKSKIDKNNWGNENYVKFDYIPTSIQNKCRCRGYILNALITSLYLRKKVKEYQANRLFVITLMAILPFAGFIIPAKIYGIIYNIYLYGWKESSLRRKVEDVTKYILLSRQSKYQGVFILNDKACPLILNKKYNCNKFKYLPDPYISITPDYSINFRKKYNIDKNKIVFSVVGALEKRKGCLNILKSISFIPDEYLEKCVFVFAGMIKSSFRETLYNEIENAKRYADIVLIDEFCSFEMIGAICKESSALLMPYLEANQSSGMFGYSSQFGIPVIGTEKGMIGKLINRYKLGITCLPESALSIADCFMKILNNEVKMPTKKYCIEHGKQHFINIIEDEM